MAYNREWDRGKEYSSLVNADVRPGFRGRGEDYYGDGKRRKFNDGGYDSEGFVYERSYANSRHDENYQSSGHDERIQRQGKKRLVPSEPSPHVIFLGLEPDFTEADLQSYLSSNGCSIETVTIIRDRSSGICSSKGFGFAQFTSTEHARAFVDPLFPFIQVPPPASHGASAKAAYYKALQTGSPHNGRRVKIDYSQSATPHDKGRLNRGHLNDGTRDIGNAPAPVLLFRGLDPLSGPQAIYQAMLHSSGPGGQGPKGMKRIILIKDKVTMASFGFAFVEFVDVQAASAVLAATMSPQIHPSGFRISDRPVAASFAHPYSFQPVADMLSRDDACIPSSIHLGGAEGSLVRYWDESSTAAVLEFKVEEPPQTAIVPAKERKEKKKRGEHETVVSAAAPTVPSELPIMDKPVTLNFGKLSAKTSSNSVKLVSLDFVSDDVAQDGEGSATDMNPEPSHGTPLRMHAPLVSTKKIVGNINKWNQVREEIMHDVSDESRTHASHVATTSASSNDKPIEQDLDFSDVTAMTCLLCARQFKTVDQLRRHNKESELHKRNYKDPGLRDIARQKVQARQTASQGQSKYRDRASERRIFFNQPEVPLSEKDPVKAENARTPSPPRSTNPGHDISNTGNKLLKMMGWTEGTGLGVSGEGRVEPIPTAFYAQGVGLGASKGKNIGKLTEGYSGYMNMIQDSVRERYNS